MCRRFGVFPISNRGNGNSIRALIDKRDENLSCMKKSWHEIFMHGNFIIMHLYEISLREFEMSMHKKKDFPA